MEIKTIPGKKNEHGPDHIILFRTVDKDGAAGWEAVTMADVASLVLMWCQNEDVLYPPSKGYRGGLKMVDFLRDAFTKGITASMTKHRLIDWEDSLKEKWPYYEMWLEELKKKSKAPWNYELK